MKKKSNDVIINYEYICKLQSKHTKLINLILNLAFPNKKFPNSLYKLGYEPKKSYCIDVEIQLDGNKTANPDIILINDKKRHILFFECKSNTIKEDQAKRYEFLLNNLNDIIYLNIREFPLKEKPEQFIGDVSYISFDDLTSNPILKNFDKFQILKVDAKEENGKIRKIKRVILKKGEYKVKELNSIFPIKIDKKHKPSFILYPFDVRNGHECIILEIYVLSALLYLALKGHEILEEGMIFKEDIVLKKGTYNFIKNITNKEEFKDFLEKHKQKIKIINGSIKILEDIIICKKGDPLEKWHIDIINAFNLDIDMDKLEKRSFSSFKLFDVFRNRFGLISLDYLYRKDKNVLANKIEEILKDIIKDQFFKDILEYKKFRRRTIWKIKIIKNQKQIEAFRDKCYRIIQKRLRNQVTLDKFIKKE